MSVKAISWAFDQRLSGNEKVVLLALADCADDDGVCWPSVAELSRKAFVSERTVQRVMLALADQGFLVFMARHADNGRQRSNQYRLSLDLGCQFDTHGGEGDTVVTGEGDSVVTPEGDNCVTPYEPSYEPSNRTITVATVQKPKSEASPDFDAFWSIYPTRDGNRNKKSAIKTFRAQVKNTDARVIIEGARRYAAHCDLKGLTGTSFVQMASTWLNAENWTESYSTPAATSSSPINPASLDEKSWRFKTQAAVNKKSWPSAWGPAPGTKDCLVPKHLITPELLKALSERRIAA